jgi:hypothetical protein
MLDSHRKVGNVSIAKGSRYWYITRMGRDQYIRLQKKYPDEFVVTNRKTGRLITHSRSIRKVLAEIRRRGIDPSKTILERFGPRDAVAIY